MRKTREYRSNSFYHVTARANRKEFIFSDDSIKQMFLNTIKRAKKKYKFVIQNICIMSNHIHFMIKPLEGENLSKIIQWLLSVFARLFNHINGYIGHVFYDRFKSKIIYNIWQFINTYWYIMENPVKAGIVHDYKEYKYQGENLFYNGYSDILLSPLDL